MTPIKYIIYMTHMMYMPYMIYMTYIHKINYLGYITNITFSMILGFEPGATIPNPARPQVADRGTASRYGG